MEDAVMAVFEASVFVLLMITIGVLLRGAIAVKDKVFHSKE